MKGSAILLLNGEPPSLKLLHQHYSAERLLLATDGAANWLAKQNITPDLILGDFDSILAETKELFANTPQLHTPDQNKTDAEKALFYLEEQGYSDISILGGLGKRQDHQLYHYSLLLKFKHLNLRLIGEEDTSFLGSGQITLHGKAGQTISLLPVYGEVEITSQGLAWDLKGERLKMGGLVSTSNHFLGQKVTLEIGRSPVLFIIGY